MRRVKGEVRYAKRRRVSGTAMIGAPGFRRPMPALPPRRGYGSVARPRGAAVTGEMKYFDTELPATSISLVTTTWVAGCMDDPTVTINLGDAAVNTPLCLFAPKVSAALNGRIGRKVVIYKVKVRGFMNIPKQSVQATTDSATLIRTMLVLDMATNAAQMTAAQLMRDAGAADTTISSFQNPDQFGRFKVLRDKTFTFSNASVTGAATVIEQSGMVRAFKMGYRWKYGLPVHFNSTNGGTVADIIDNSLHVIDGTNDTSLAPTVQYYARVAYKDV